jgi:hypothetical protein
LGIKAQLVLPTVHWSCTSVYPLNEAGETSELMGSAPVELSPKPYPLVVTFQLTQMGVLVVTTKMGSMEAG